MHARVLIPVVVLEPALAPHAPADGRFSRLELAAPTEARPLVDLETQTDPDHIAERLSAVLELPFEAADYLLWHPFHALERSEGLGMTTASNP